MIILKLGAVPSWEDTLIFLQRVVIFCVTFGFWYINDISDGILNNIRWFADDTSVFAIVDNNIFTPSMSLIWDLEKIKIIWSKFWAVDFNGEKKKPD